ncbi:hypothetical protein Zmor_020070 [Zophobas morio]|uniref:Guanylate cyclase domain-containing protein n=1 Tax=Zophobas morio TaxID=2755281 RepID=A0AA38I0V0_9CUCU|nr:hypothetical protein Zmor_020070 [Zophobas morio]
MEGLNHTGQEEYIWAMRASLYRESDVELWKDRKRHDNSRSAVNVASRTKSLLETTTYQTKIMASLVPDEVIHNVEDYSHRQYEACFLFGDVSGFTELCEKYTKTGVSGPSRMTQVLNKYLGAMVQEVLSYNGDILKFSGDAFLAVFKSSEDTTMRDSVHEALDCALVIQKSYGSYLTDVNVVIRVKLAISAGLVTFALIGEPSTCHYVVVGKPIWDVKAAEHISSAGDIIVAPAAWHYVNPGEYIHKEMPDRVHMKIVGIGPNWRSVQKNVRQQKTKEQMAEDVFSLELSSESLDQIEEKRVLGAMAGEEFSLRPAVNLAVRLKIRELLRGFIIAPVMKSIDMNEPLEYLSEMRQAVIVFINVVSHKINTTDTVILADRAYKTVCRVVHQMNGCVNKVSLFDKDLMFVVIFGLRGLKNELECQVALRCARECHQAISEFENVASTSVGVTTGKTYCGVFGHTLRREYTVISLIVNKAARLMVAYSGKVTCDRETFLHSKLEAKHFVLQEPKPLKGISHPGPVYEFRELEEDHGVLHRVNPRPLLGRAENLKIYKQLLERFQSTTTVDEQQYKMLLIRGEARQGKTRLLDELVYITPEEILISRFTLTPKDRKVPFQTVRLIFNQPMATTVDSTIKIKQAKILEKLSKIKNPDLLCVLNQVFGVNFPNSQLFMQLSEQEKLKARRTVINWLCLECFPTLWVVAIDNCDYIDEESWHIFDTFFEIRTLFIVATASRDKLAHAEICEKVLSDDPRIKTIYLKPVEKWYLGALACQILDVYAISPELENAIQVKSNGNPGWIESFLISLIQDEGLYILQAHMSYITDLGLVAPPLYLMARLTEEEAFKWQHIMEERKRPGESEIDQSWQKYIDCCRDSYMNVSIRELLEHISLGGRIPICVISPNFHVGDEEAELSMDAMILKTFDSLNFFEQLLVKCSAILGLQFLRDMLLYVMNATDKRKTALAVQKLFEIRVLTCAKGDFLEGTGTLFKEKLIHPNEEAGLQCRCRGVKIDETCYDLPKYASCGLLQFRFPQFREITYNLLTDNQKKEFHHRAIRYLEKETRKCKACGGGFFERILGGDRIDKDMALTKKKVKRDEGSFDTASLTVSRTDSQYSGTSTTYSLGSATKSRRRVAEDGKSVASFASVNIVHEKKKKREATFGFVMIKKLKDSYSLTKTFSSEDFTDCQCLLILSTTYSQLIEHCIGAGDINKVINAMLEYSYISITLCNLPLALQILEEAKHIVNKKAKETVEHSWKYSLIRGKIYTLIGYARLELAQYQTAFINLHKSLEEYGVNFPTSRITRHIKTRLFEFKQLFGFYLLPNSLTKRLDHWETIFAGNLAESLSHLCNLYLIKNQWKNAELAATWCLSKSLEAYSSFQLMTTAYANMLHIAQHLRRWNICIALEIHALRLCRTKKSTVDAEDLKSVAKLYSAIFFSRMLRSSLDKAIHMGYTVLRICTSVRAVKIILPVLPLFLHALLIGSHFSNALSMMQELEYFANEDSDSTGKVWYLALCVGIQLETGYSVIPYHICETYYQMEGDRWITIRDPDARRRFYTVMWLWCVRNEKWEQAATWCLKTQDFKIITENDSLANKVTALYLLEGMIIFLVAKLDKRNIKAVIRAETDIEILIKELQKASKTAKFILPRLYHLKAYYKFVKYFHLRVSSLLKRPHKLATKYGHQLEVSWLEHSGKAWQRTLPPLTVQMWRDHSEAGNLLEFQEIETEQKLVFFTLPVPIYI